MNRKGRSATLESGPQGEIEIGSDKGAVAPSQGDDAVITREAAIGSEARLSWLLSGLAGMVGAVAFLHSAGYFVTFMTGNTERAVLTWFKVTDKQQVAGAGPIAAISMIGAFLFGVIVASYCRRKFWKNHPHGATVLTTVGLLALPRSTSIRTVASPRTSTCISRRYCCWPSRLEPSTHRS